MVKKIKYTLKVVESYREYVNHADEDRLLVHYKIFKAGQKKTVHGVKEHFPVDIEKADLKLALKKALDLYTSEHQPVPKEVRDRLKAEEKTDKLAEDIVGTKL